MIEYCIWSLEFRCGALNRGNPATVVKRGALAFKSWVILRPFRQRRLGEGIIMIDATGGRVSSEYTTHNLLRRVPRNDFGIPLEIQGRVGSA